MGSKLDKEAILDILSGPKLLGWTKEDQVAEIQALIDRKEIEARIDEIGRLVALGKSYGFGETFAIGNKFIQDRIAELNQLAEKGSK